MPKLAVICLCFNHSAYVQEALASVLKQTSTDWELIVVDDASTDTSVEKIKAFIERNPFHNIKTIFSSENEGNCKAFNRALTLSTADYIIDLAADDILLPQRVACAIDSMEENNNIALNFCNAMYINAEGEMVSLHYPVNRFNHTTISVPQGDVFTEIIARYFICSPTMVYRASFLKKIGGYDETLAYEDFDIKIRLARVYPFSYTDKILVKKRILQTSMSKNQYKKNNHQLASTYKICLKIYFMLRNKSEKKAFLNRVAFEGRQSLLHGRMYLFSKFSSLWFKTLFKNV